MSFCWRTSCIFPIITSEPQDNALLSTAGSIRWTETPAELAFWLSDTCKTQTINKGEKTSTYDGSCEESDCNTLSCSPPHGVALRGGRDAH